MVTCNYSLLGPPGSGKGTQAELLKKEFGFAHIETGSELRAVAEQDTEIGRTVDEIIHHRGELVSNSIMEEVFRQAIARVPAEQGIIFDGAPRYVNQIEVFERILGEYKRKLSGVIFIDIPEEECVARISKRYLCFGCHRPYIFGKDITTMDAICQFCGGRIGQRKDDTPEGVRKRFSVFQKETYPVIEHFDTRGTAFRVDGKQEPEKIFQSIKEHIKTCESL
jgi:adenylate kinase